MKKIILKLTHISIMLIVTIFVFSCCSGKTQIGDSNSEIINSPQIENRFPSASSDVLSNETIKISDIDWSSAYRYSGEIYNSETGESTCTDGNIDTSSLIKRNITDTAIFIGGLSESSAYFTTLSFRYNDDEKIIGKLTNSVSIDERTEYINILDSVFTGETTRNIKVKDNLDENSTGYTDEYGEQYRFRTNSDWNITPTKYLYINYDKDERKPKQIWIDELEKMIEEDTGSTDTPAIIRESWQFSTGGYNIAIINACNIYNNGYYTTAEYDETIYPSSDKLPYGKNHYIYSLTVIFINDKIVDCINVNGEEKYYMHISSDPLNYKEGIKISLSAPVLTDVTDGDGKSINMVILRDDAGDNKAFKLYYVYDSQDILKFKYYSQPSFSVLDVDGDGAGEIIGFNIGYYGYKDSNDVVYQIINSTSIQLLGTYQTNRLGYKLFPFRYIVKY